MAPVAAGAYPMERFLPSSTFDVTRMFSDLRKLFESIEDSFGRRLALTLLDDEEIQRRMERAPAAKSVHHAYVGGLLEHTLSVCRVLDFLAMHYRNYYGKAVSRDLLLLGGLFHDIGKIYELQYERGTEYTTAGKLVGHHVIGCELIDRFANRIEGFPDTLRLLTKHQVLAHHGKLEYGSPKVPHTLEALLVHVVDDLDSKVNSILGLIATDMQSGEWTANSRMYERTFWKPAEKPLIQGSSPGLP